MHPLEPQLELPRRGGVVHQDVDRRAERGLRGADDGAAVGVDVGEVGDHRHCVAPGRGDDVDGLLERPRVRALARAQGAGGHRHPGTFGRQPLGDGAPDAAAGAGDQRDLAVTRSNHGPRSPATRRCSVTRTGLSHAPPP